MSFAQDVKDELCQKEERRVSKAQAYGMILFSRIFSVNKVGIQTEKMAVASLYQEALKQHCGIDAPIYTENDMVFSVSCGHPAQLSKIFAVFCCHPKDRRQEIQYSFFTSSGDISQFLRGAYLVCGNMSDPLKQYHFEFSVNQKELANHLAALLLEAGFPAKVSARKSSTHAVYIKESGGIEDILTFLGATRAALHLMNIKIYKELRNNANRITNFEAANISKSARAAADQVYNIRYIIERKGLDYLPEELREVAKMRMDFPELTLKELAEGINPPVSRATVNRRLQKIKEMADLLRQKEDSV